MHMLSYNREFVYAEKVETLIRAMQACGALGIPFPTKDVVKWLDTQTLEYDNTPDFWQPYGFMGDSQPYLHSWARGAFGYLYRTTGIEAPAIETIDPALWSHGVLARIAECSPDARTLAAAQIMNEQTDPELVEWLERDYLKIRVAQEAKRILVDPVKIRRRMKVAPPLSQVIR